MRPHTLVLISLLGLTTGCGIEMPTGGNQPQVIVRHRCGDTNFDDLSGTYGKLQGENGVNSKFRVLFSSEGDNLTANWVAGGFEVVPMAGVKSDSDHAVFTQTGSGDRSRVWASITTDCRLEAQFGTVDGSGAESKSPVPADKYVPFPDLASRDFEPCTELLHRGSAGRSYSAAKKATRPATPAVVRSSKMPVAAWSPAGEVGPGCIASFDLWTDGQSMEIIGAKTVEEKDGMLRWHHPYENDFLGLHGVSMHRKVKCAGGEEKLLGVACLSVEVK